MLKTITYRVRIGVLMSVVAVGLLAAPAFFISTVQAQASDISEKLLPLATELGCETKVACASSFTANFSKGLDLAEKYDIYNTEQKTLAKSFKQEVLANLTDVSEGDFEQKIIEIANNLVKNKPSLAKQLGVNAQGVKAAETIVAELKSVGANLTVCSRPADTLAREELITCLNASRKLAERAGEVKTYITKERLTTATNALNLEESLRRGEYGNLGLTADEVGMKCLRSDSPAVCDEIASKFFGEQGVKMLKEAKAQVTQTEEFYRQNVKDYTLTVSGGGTFIGKEAISGVCESAFKEKNIALVRACGEFAVKNGFASQVDVSRALEIVQSVTDKNINFDLCVQDPAACDTYVSNELRGEFDAMREIDKIMRQEMGFDPMQCNQSATNPEIGKKCLEASRRALPQIEAISTNSKEAQQLVANIKKQIIFGEEAQNQKNKIQQELTVGGGPGGCKNEEECNKFCAKPENGPECLAFGTKQGFYKEDEIAQRFEVYNQQFIMPTDYIQPMYPTMASGTLPNAMTGGGMGQSPECFAAIQMGDFAKAKQICSVLQTLSINQTSMEQYQQSYQPVCPMIFPAPCPMGQYREQQIMNGCSVFGACVLYQGTKIQLPTQPQPCPQVPPCSSGQYHPTEFNGCLKTECLVSQWQQPSFPINQGACTGSQIRCYSPGSPDGWCQMPPCPVVVPATSCPSGNYWDGSACVPSTSVPPTACTGSQVWCPSPSGGPGWCQMPPCSVTTTPPVTTTCPTGQYWYMPSAGGTGYCRDNASVSACTGSQIRCYNSSTPDGWSQMTPCPPVTPSTTCPSGNYWDGSACVPSTPVSPTACTGSQIRCYNSSTPDGWCQMPPCPSSSSGTVSCSGSYSSNGGQACNYSMCPNGCIIGQNGCPTGCMSPPQISDCPSGQYWCAPTTSGASGWCQSSPCPSSSSGTVSCSGAYSGGGYACNFSMCPNGCTFGSDNCPNGCMSSPPPSGSGSCTGSQVWCPGSSGAAGWCQMPPCPVAVTPTTCPSGNYWDGSACVPSTPPSCPDGNYWNGSACVVSGILSENQLAEIASAFSNLRNEIFGLFNLLNLPR
ncbi:MAG: hypothetical protein V1705_01360 [bacterium]